MSEPASPAIPPAITVPVWHGADMRTQIDNHPWHTTPLGPRAQWPASLRTIVALMLDSNEAMVVWWGNELLQIYNDAYAPRVAGLDGGTALGLPAAHRWKNNWADIGPQAARVMAGLPPTGYENFLVNMDRNGGLEDTYWSYSFTPVRDDQGAIRGMLIISTDTTERVLSARRQQTLDTLRQHLALIDTADALPAAVELAANGNRLDLPVVALLAPQSGEGVHASSLAPDEQLITGRDVGIDTDLGLLFKVSASLPFDASYRSFLDQFALLVATARHRIDAEARRRIVEAERDRLLLDAPVGAAVMIGEELVYHLVNAIYSAVSGRPADAMVGRPFIEVFPELEGSPVHAKFLEVFRSGVPFISPPTLVQIHRHGGALDDRYFTYNLAPLRALDGKVYGLMVVAVDITVEVDSRAQVERLNADLQAAARAKDEFLALLGHELRNPLAPIVTALELMRLRDRASDREQVIIRRQVSHLTRLVDDLLDVSRITRGKVELRKESVDVREILTRAVEMVTPVVEQRHQRLRLSMDAGQWYGDPARLAQIVSNLLTNASRYSQAESEIALRASVSASELRIEVADNGMGLADELLPRIFEPFVQGERKLHGSVGGLGIGLALVKNLTELHGGTVTATSAGIGQGSTFVVRLPMRGPLVPGNDWQRSNLAEAPLGRRILIVDDNSDAANTLAELLRLHGHQVVTAYAVETAQQIFTDTPLDLAILDIGLPGMSGYQLAELMRRSGRNPDVPFVALSGFGQEIDKERSARAGFAAHFTKPLTPEALDDLVKVAPAAA